MEQGEIQQTLVRLMERSGGVQLIKMTHPGMAQLGRDLQAVLGITESIDAHQINQAMWSLIARELAYVALSAGSPGDWRLHLTERGYAIVRDQQINPDDPAGYIERIVKQAPSTTDTVKLYLREALKTYVDRSYLASAVMLGVAAEATMLETATAYVRWAGPAGEKLKSELENPRRFYVFKLEEFQKRLSVEKPKFPPEIGDNLDLDVTSVLQLIRLTRNDAGHPTGRVIDRDACFSHLVVYARVHTRLHGLKEFFTTAP
jgi:hypothetical protein